VRNCFTCAFSLIHHKHQLRSHIVCSARNHTRRRVDHGHCAIGTALASRGSAGLQRSRASRGRSGALLASGCTGRGSAMLLGHVKGLTRARIVLASGSPRRRELLSSIGLKFEVGAGRGGGRAAARPDISPPGTGRRVVRERRTNEARAAACARSVPPGSGAARSCAPRPRCACRRLRRRCRTAASRAPPTMRSRRVRGPRRPPRRRGARAARGCVAIGIPSPPCLTQGKDALSTSLSHPPPPTPPQPATRPWTWSTSWSSRPRRGTGEEGGGGPSGGADGA
jgi:hypothetical protein